MSNTNPFQNWSDMLAALTQPQKESQSPSQYPRSSVKCCRHRQHPVSSKRAIKRLKKKGKGCQKCRFVARRKKRNCKKIKRIRRVHRMMKRIDRMLEFQNECAQNNDS